MERASKMVPRADIFAQSGVQFMDLNSLNQLLAWKAHAPAILEAADTLLFMPDFFHWCLCGAKKSEFTAASTSQFVHPEKRNWSLSLLERLGLPTHFLPKIVFPGTTLGTIRKSLAERLGLASVKVVTPPAHDTASAVAGIPTRNTGNANWAFISSGTWSVMGIEINKAVLSPRALEMNMANEGGIDGKYNLLKNIMGLWLVQQCRRSFATAGRQYNYAQLVQIAGKAKSLRSLINPDESRFLNPPNMPNAIKEFCRETKQPVPRTDGAVVRCAYESLALKYSETLGSIEELTGEHIEIIHIVGGGSRNLVLNQFVADACQRTVVTGPVEATTMGNLLTQVRASGEIGSLIEMRGVIRNSSHQKRYDPSPTGAWTEAVGRFTELRMKN
jgi:rhamnulokinase